MTPRNVLLCCLLMVALCACGDAPTDPDRHIGGHGVAIPDSPHAEEMNR